MTQPSNPIKMWQEELRSESFLYDCDMLDYEKLESFIEKTINAEVHAALNAVEVESEPEKTDRYARETGQFISDEYSQRELGFDSACKVWRKAKSEALKEYPIK